MADAGPCRMDADNFPPQTRTNDMAKGNSQKKSDGTAVVIHGIDASLGPRNADSFRQNLHPDLKADFILTQLLLGELRVPQLQD